MDSLKKAVTGLKDRIVKTPLERSILEACSDENWGSANSALHDIAEKTFNHEDRQTIMKTIWELLKSPGKEWRRIYKVLNLIEIFLKFGSGSCLHEVQDNAFKIRMLQDFTYRENNEEKGTGVRDKAKYICSMLNDKNFYEEEKEKAKKTRSKFSGISSDTGYSKYNETSWRNDSYDPYISRSYQSDSSYSNNYSQPSRTNEAYDERKPPAEPVDIFKAPDVKPVKIDAKPSIWDKEPGRLPAAPKVLRPPPGSGTAPVQSIFEVPTIKKVPDAPQYPQYTNPVINNESSFTSKPPSVDLLTAFTQPSHTYPQAPSFQAAPLVQPPSSFPQATTIQPPSSFPQVTTIQPPSSFPQATIAQPISSYKSNPILQPNPSYQPAPSYQPIPIVQSGPSFPQSLSFQPNPVYQPNPNPSPINPYQTSGQALKPAIYIDALSGVFPSTTSHFNPQSISRPVETGLRTQSYNTYSGPSIDNTGLSGLYIQGSTNVSINQQIPGSNPQGMNAMKVSGPKVNFNISNDSGATMEQIKQFGRTDYMPFQSSSDIKAPIDLESKLLNLDDLQAGQPKPREIVKSRW